LHHSGTCRWINIKIISGSTWTFIWKRNTSFFVQLLLAIKHWYDYEDIQRDIKYQNILPKRDHKNQISWFWNFTIDSKLNKVSFNSNRNSFYVAPEIFKHESYSFPQMVGVLDTFYMKWLQKSDYLEVIIFHLFKMSYIKILFQSKYNGLMKWISSFLIDSRKVYQKEFHLNIFINFHSFIIFHLIKQKMILLKTRSSKSISSTR
jgi:hypothetical protein